MKSTYWTTVISSLANQNNHSSKDNITSPSIPDSGSAPQMSASLDSLPAELFDKLAEYLDTKSLHALRSISKSAEKMAFSNFANRAFRQMTLAADPRCLQVALGDFKRFAGDESFRVRSVDLVSGRVPGSQDPDAVSAAILKFCSKLTHLRCLTVRTLWERGAPSPYLDTALEATSMLKLTQVNLTNMTLSLETFLTFLASTHIISSLELKCVYQKHRESVVWTDVFHAILTSLKLRRLFVSELHSAKRHDLRPRLYDLLPKHLRRIQHGVRNTEASAKSSYEYYYLTPSSAQMCGVMGVKAGTKSILEYKGVDVPTEQ